MKKNITYLILMVMLIFITSSCSKHTHDYTELVIVKEATCEETGIGYYVCYKQDARTQDITIPALGHDYQESYHLGPTCLQDGLSKNICSRCGKVQEEVLPALNHDLVEHPGVAATCEEDGYDTYYTCSRCDYIQPHEIYPALGHDLVEHLGVAATCEEDGYDTYYACSRCDYIQPHEIYSALGHDLVVQETIQPTCLDDGSIKYICSRCGKEKIEIVKALSHDWQKTSDSVIATYDTRGYDVEKCAICGELKVSEDSPYTYKEPSQIEADISLISSYCNDDTYFYFVKLAHITDYVYHSYNCFQITDSMTISPNPSVSNVTELKDYYEEKKKIWFSDENALSKLNFNLSETDFDEYVKNALAENSLISLESDMKTISEAINALDYKKECTLDNLENPETGEEIYHYFTAIGDVDIYAGITYDVTSASYSYYPISVPVTDNDGNLNISIQHIVSNTNALLTKASPIDNCDGLANCVNNKPTEYTTNHPLKNYESNYDGSISVLKGGSGSYTVTINDYNSLIEDGYDRVKLEVSFNTNCGGLWNLGTASVIACFVNGNNGRVGDNHTYDIKQSDGGNKRESFSTTAYSSLFNNGVFGLYFVHSSGLALDISSINFTFTFFNSTAYNNGAYSGLL